MRTSTPIILAKLCAAALAPLVAGAVTAETVSAETARDPDIPVSVDNALWGVHRHPHHGRPYGYGFTGHQLPGQYAPGPLIRHFDPRILDCVHVTFPQCSGGG